MAAESFRRVTHAVRPSKESQPRSRPKRTPGPTVIAWPQLTATQIEINVAARMSGRLRMRTIQGMRGQGRRAPVRGGRSVKGVGKWHLQSLMSPLQHETGVRPKNGLRRSASAGREFAGGPQAAIGSDA